MEYDKLAKSHGICQFYIEMVMENKEMVMDKSWKNIIS